MTILGKILAIVNLVLSLFVMALVIMTYIARTNWHVAFEQQEKLYKAAKADAEAYKNETSQRIEELKTERAASKKATGDLDKATQDFQVALKAEQARTAKELEKNKVLQANQTKETGENSRREAEVKYLKDNNAKLLAEKVKMEEQMQAFRDRAVQAEIASSSQQERNERLLDENRRLNKEVARAQQPPATGTLTSNTKSNPPSEDVEGVIKHIDPETGYVTLSIGSDSGLTRGHTLHVFRMRPESKYLGKLEILQVAPNEAVAKPVQRLSALLQVGDTVSNKITVRR